MIIYYRRQETSLYIQELLKKAGAAHAAAVVCFIKRHGMQVGGAQWLASYPLPLQSIQASQRDSFVVESFCPAAAAAVQAIACIPILKPGGSIR